MNEHSFSLIVLPESTNPGTAFCLSKHVPAGQMKIKDIEPLNSTSNKYYTLKYGNANYYFFTNRNDFYLLSQLSEGYGEKAKACIIADQESQYESATVFKGASEFMNVSKIGQGTSLNRLPVGVTIEFDRFSVTHWMEWAASYISEQKFGVISMLRTETLEDREISVMEYEIDHSKINLIREIKQKEAEALHGKLFSNFIRKSDTAFQDFESRSDKSISMIAFFLNENINKYVLLTENLSEVSHNSPQLEQSVIEKLVSLDPDMATLIINDILQEKKYSNHICNLLLVGGLYHPDPFSRACLLYLLAHFASPSWMKSINKLWKEEYHKNFQLIPVEEMKHAKFDTQLISECFERMRQNKKGGSKSSTSENKPFWKFW